MKQHLIKVDKPKQGIIVISPNRFIFSSLAFIGIKVIPKSSLLNFSPCLLKKLLIEFSFSATSSSFTALVNTITIGNFFPSYFSLNFKITSNSSSKNLFEVVQYKMQWICSFGSLLFNFSVICFKVSCNTSINLCPVPISVPIVSNTDKNGTNLDSYFLVSRVVRVPEPSLAIISPNISLINVLFPTPEFPIAIKFIFSSSFAFIEFFIVEINLLFILSFIFSLSKSSSNNVSNFFFRLFILF